MYSKDFIKHTTYYISLLDKVSPLLDCADAIEIYQLNQLDTLNDNQTSKAFRIILKYSALISYWGNS